MASRWGRRSPSSAASSPARRATPATACRCFPATAPAMADANRVLILAPVGRDGPASAELLAKAGLAPTVCPALAALVGALPRGSAAVFVAEEALFGRALGPLEGWLAGQPPWSDLPFVVLTSHRQDPRVEA